MSISKVPAGGTAYSILITTAGIGPNSTSFSNNNVTNTASFVLNTTVSAGVYKATGLFTDSTNLSVEKSTSVTMGTQTATVNTPFLYTSTESSSFKLNIPAMWTSRMTLVRTGWTTATLGPVGYGNGRYLVGEGSTGSNVTAGTATSTDGLTWVSGPSTILPSKFLKYVNNRWFGGRSTDGTASGSSLVTSTDGITWATTGVVFTTQAKAINDISYGNGAYVAVGNTNNTGTLGAGIHWSTDGTTWTTRTSAIPLASNPNHTSITYGNSGFLATATVYPYLISSTDGITWTTRDAGWSTTGGTPAATVWNGTKYYVMDDATSPQVRSSTDLITWTLDSTINAARNRAANGNLNGGGLVWVSSISALVYPTDSGIKLSSNGVTWIEKDTQQNLNYGIAVGPSIAVAAGTRKGTDLGTNLTISDTSLCGYTVETGGVLLEKVDNQVDLLI